MVLSPPSDPDGSPAFLFSPWPRPREATRPALLTALLLAIGLASFGCQSDSGVGTDKRPIVELTASEFSLQGRSVVSSGWITFRLKNSGDFHHSFKLRKLPEGQTFEDYQRGLLAPADSFESALVEGRIDSATYQKEMRRAVPDWYGEVKTVGGITGLAPGRTAEIIHKLGPGHYVLSCFFRTPENRTHALLGVRSGLRVTADSSGASPPEPDLTARLSPEAFEVDTSAFSDNQTIAFRSAGGAGGEASPVAGLFRLTSETGPQDIADWMEEGLPLPAPTKWIGGPEPMPAGDVAYVRVGDLQPGRYAWITVAAPDTSGMVKTFTVGTE